MSARPDGAARVSRAAAAAPLAIDVSIRDGWRVATSAPLPLRCPDEDLLARHAALPDGVRLIRVGPAGAPALRTECPAEATGPAADPAMALRRAVPLALAPTVPGPRAVDPPDEATAAAIAAAIEAAGWLGARPDGAGVRVDLDVAPDFAQAVVVPFVDGGYRLRCALAAGEGGAPVHPVAREASAQLLVVAGAWLRGSRAVRVGCGRDARFALEAGVPAAATSLTSTASAHSAAFAAASAHAAVFAPAAATADWRRALSALSVAWRRVAREWAWLERSPALARIYRAHAGAASAAGDARREPPRAAAGAPGAASVAAVARSGPMA